MANKTINDLDTAAAFAADDEIAIWDTSASATKKATAADFVGAAGAYAFIYTARGSTAQTGIGTSFVKLTGFASDGAAADATPDQANNKITVNTTGTYQISLDVSFSGSSSATFSFEVYVNGASIDLGLQRKLGTAGDVGNSGCGGLAAITTGQDVEVYVKADGASKSITPVYLNLFVHRVA
jgi:hypothetical protein